MTQALLGIDIGTSGCKALLIDGDGAVLASRTETYGLSQPHPGWTEQDPQSWIEGARAAVASVLARRPDAVIDAVGLSGQMHGATPLDASHSVLRPAQCWRAFPPPGNREIRISRARDPRSGGSRRPSARRSGVRGGFRR